MHDSMARISMADEAQSQAANDERAEDEGEDAEDSGVGDVGSPTLPPRPPVLAAGTARETPMSAG